MTSILVPFLKVATFDSRRRPNIQINSEIDTWALGCKGRVDREFLIGRSKDPDTWKVRFEFQKNEEALLFKLTFGGA
jgi:hypothetical protein